MKSKLTIFPLLLLLFALGLDAAALATEATAVPAFKPDGVNAVAQRRKRRRLRKSQRRAKTYAIEVPPNAGVMHSPPPEVAPAPPPPPEAAPAAAPPPVGASPNMDAPGGGRSSSPAKKSAPRIKPPTVMIKPPTE